MICLTSFYPETYSIKTEKNEKETNNYMWTWFTACFIVFALFLKRHDGGCGGGVGGGGRGGGGVGGGGGGGGGVGGGGGGMVGK